jgi:hypothetical protein
MAAHLKRRPSAPLVQDQVTAHLSARADLKSPSKRQCFPGCSARPNAAGVAQLAEHRQSFLLQVACDRVSPLAPTKRSGLEQFRCWL